MAGPATLYQTGDHASRPANGAGCVLYACSTHGLIYLDNGTSWSTFADLSALVGTVDAADVNFTPNGSIAATDVQAAIQEVRDEAGGSSGPLSRVVYDPGTEAVYTTSSGTFADVDATNLLLPDFAAPASGEVEVHANMLCRIGGANGVLQFNVRDGSGDISGSDTFVGWVITNIDVLLRYHVVMRVTGLTPAANQTGWKLGFARGGGTATNMGPRMGGINGPGIVSVHAV